CMQAIAFPLTF
nr:immunoglobulin light chain junction region [Macaca mulatta]